MAINLVQTHKAHTHTINKTNMTKTKNKTTNQPATSNKTLSKICVFLLRLRFVLCFVRSLFLSFFLSLNSLVFFFFITIELFVCIMQAFSTKCIIFDFTQLRYSGKVEFKKKTRKKHTHFANIKTSEQ